MATVENFFGRRIHCTACTLIKNGVKSRKALKHTCGLDVGAVPEFPKRDTTNHVVVGGELLKQFKEIDKKK